MAVASSSAHREKPNTNKTANCARALPSFLLISFFLSFFSEKNKITSLESLNTERKALSQRALFVGVVVVVRFQR